MYMTDFTITGQQIALRDFLLKDVDAFIAWQQPGHRWQYLDAPYYKSDDRDLDAFKGKLTKRFSAPDYVPPNPRERVTIADKDTDALIGQVSWYWISEATNWAAIGIVIFDPAHWGKGIGYEAFGLWSDYLFDSFPAWARLDLRTWSGNAGMMRLAEKLGYHEEARFRMARIVDGDYYDGMGYGVLRGEWKGRYPNGFAATL